MLLSRSNWSPESLTAIEGGVVVVFIFHIIIAVVVTKNCKQKYSIDQGVSLQHMRTDAQAMGGMQKF